MKNLKIYMFCSVNFSNEYRFHVKIHPKPPEMDFLKTSGIFFVILEHRVAAPDVSLF